MFFLRETERGLSLILGKSVDWWQVCRKPVHIRSRHVYVRNQEGAVTEVFGLIVFCDMMDDDSGVELALPLPEFLSQTLHPVLFLLLLGLQPKC